MLESKKSQININLFVNSDAPLVSLVRKKGTETRIFNYRTSKRR